MLPLLTLLVSALCFGSVLGSRSAIYNRVDIPKGWSRLHEARGNEELEFTVVFRAETDLNDLFWSVSTPSSDNYGNFLTYDEVTNLVRLNDADRSSFLDALREHHIGEDAITLDAGDSLRIKAPVRHLESFFNTKFHHFVHSHTGFRTIKQLGEYSVPSSIKDNIRMIFGLHTFPTVQQRLDMVAAGKMRRAADVVRRASQQREDAVTPVYVPQSINSLYGMPVLIPGSNKTVTAAVIEFVNETFSPEDLTTFGKNVNVQVSQPSHIIGNNTEAPEGVEAALDIQWISVNPALDPWFWLESDPNVWLYTFTQDFLSAKEVPQIISMSYGLPEIDQCDFFTPSDCGGLSYSDYVMLVDVQFQKMGLMGVSAIVCSQDRGVYASLADPAVFTPEYPGTSSYVTSVGATQIVKAEYKLDSPPPACSVESGWQCVSGGLEVAVSYDVASYLSGGGFSNIDGRPSYQSLAVDSYLKSGVKLPVSGVYNSTSRGCPDLSAIGTNGYIYAGVDTLVGGTSMSTPIIAAIVGLLQADYSAITNKPLGFLNPMIYEAAASNPEVFNDITIGDNCQTSKCAGVQDGFLATKGWDPVTGLGSPVVGEWRKYIAQHAQKQVEKQAKQVKLVKQVKQSKKVKKNNIKRSSK